jgi:hypothetical protein
MVAQTKADVRSAADKPVPSGKKGVQQDALVEGKELLDDQAVAAAVVDAEQADAVAVQVAADGGIMPTEAPTQSIGEVAQMTTPTTTDTTTTTTAPAVEEAAPAMSPWAVGGIALLGVGAIALAANNDDDDDNPPAPPPIGDEPPPVPPPTPVNNAPTTQNAAVVADADDVTTIPAGTFTSQDVEDGTAVTTVRIGAITPTMLTDLTTNPALEINTTTGHGYELVTGAVTWAAAQAAAEARGGYLAILDTPEEAVFVNDSFLLGTGDPNSDGTWVGAYQSASTTAPLDIRAGWAWDNNTATGIPIATDSPIWSGTADFTTAPDTLGGDENQEAQFGAIFEGFGEPTSPGIMFDYGVDTDAQARYLIEYDTPMAPLELNGTAVQPGAVIAAADLGNLTWNSVFNSGGTVAFAVGDSAGAYSAESTLTIAAPPVATVSTMIDDQHLNVLA